MKKRKLFCEYGPIFYEISLFKESQKKNLVDIVRKNKFSKLKTFSNYKYIWKSHMSLICRKLDGVDMRLQENKAKNLEIAGKKIDGLIVRPGEVFSFWNTVGRPTNKKGYQAGLIISSGKKIERNRWRIMSISKFNTLYGITYTT